MSGTINQPDLSALEQGLHGMSWEPSLSFVLVFRTANGLPSVEPQRIAVPEESVEARPEEHPEPGAFLVPVGSSNDLMDV